MIPNVTVKHGQHLSKTNEEKLVEKALASKDFQDLLSVIEQNTEVSKEKYLVDVAAKYEFTLPEKDVVFVNAAVLKFEESANAMYFEIIKPNEVQEIIIGGIRKEDKFLNLYVNADGVGTHEVEYEGQLEGSFANVFPNTANYTEGQSLNDEVSAQFIEGCYPGYNHCGKGCGDYGPKGGGSTVNGMDTCCRTHDRCWYNFGNGDCQCDCDFISCADRNVNQSNALLYTIIRGYFSCC